MDISERSTAVRAPERQRLLRILARHAKAGFQAVLFEVRRRRNIRTRDKVLTTYLAGSTVHRLHIGAGANVLPGWLNTDLEPQKAGIAYLDVSDPLPFADSSFDFIFSEHLIEHLPHEVGAYHLGECYRVLRAGGRVRVATPDMQFLIDIYTRGDHTDTQAKYIRRTLEQAFPRTGFFSGAFVLNHFVRHWGHQFIYDELTLTEALRRVGFSSVRRWAVADSDEASLRNIEHHGDAISEEFNRMQTIVCEGTK